MHIPIKCAPYAGATIAVQSPAAAPACPGPVNALLLKSNSLSFAVCVTSPSAAAPISLIFPAAEPQHLPHLINAFKGYLWTLKTCHSGADLDTAATMSRGHLDEETNWMISDMLEKRCVPFGWILPQLKPNQIVALILSLLSNH